MLNLVTDVEDEGAAVLVRAAELVEGEALVRARRGTTVGDHAVLLAGPGKVGAALALDASFSGHALFTRGGLEVHAGTFVEDVSVGPRVGIDYARPADRDAPYRFADSRSRVVTRRRTLRPLVRFARPSSVDRTARTR
jgi:DNA-3-methyladenine glycosylase